MAKVFAQADFIKGLRDRVELEFDAHSKLAVPFGGAAVDLTETLSAALASDEAVSYGLQMKHDMRQVGHGDAYEGEMAWWLLTHDAVLTLHLQAVTDDNYRVSTNVLVRRYPAAKLWHAEVREGHVQAPGAIRSHRDSCVLVLHFPGGEQLRVESGEIDPGSGRSAAEAVHRFAAGVVVAARREAHK